ncbi:hypothetical protein [Dactylosporangium salmoneum]|uniref:Uncharacterized protein n=1 Tax=Dactylosporangium salmoneum TaxID=53361 RepID=A0ABP5TAJ0_9ACTN
MTSAESPAFRPVIGRHRRRGDFGWDFSAWLVARLLDAGEVMFTGFVAGVVIVAAAAAIFTVFAYFVGGR